MKNTLIALLALALSSPALMAQDGDSPAGKWNTPYPVQRVEELRPLPYEKDIDSVSCHSFRLRVAVVARNSKGLPPTTAAGMWMRERD